MKDVQQLLVQQVRVMKMLETRFEKLLIGGQLTQFSAQDVRDAIQISAQHKVLAMEAIERERFDQAVHNIETVLYIMSGFVDGSTPPTQQQYLN
jgi:hypothetical protein